MFFQPTPIHHNQQSRIKRALRRSVIDDAFLEPNSLGSNRYCIVDCVTSLIRTPKHINKIDLFWHIRK